MESMDCWFGVSSILTGRSGKAESDWPGQPVVGFPRSANIIACAPREFLASSMCSLSAFRSSETILSISASSFATMASAQRAWIRVSVGEAKA